MREKLVERVGEVTSKYIEGQQQLSLPSYIERDPWRQIPRVNQIEVAYLTIEKMAKELIEMEEECSKVELETIDRRVCTLFNVRSYFYSLVGPYIVKRLEK